MNDTLVRLPSGQLRVSRIVYFTDLLHSDSREIPIGAVGEVRLPKLRAIGTALRPKVDGADLDLIGPAARELLADPTKGLWPHVLEAFEQAEPGRALEQLSLRFSSSISVLAPECLEVPRQWLIERDIDRLVELVRDRMRVTLTDAYFDFLFPPRDGIEDPSVEEDVRKEAA